MSTATARKAAIEFMRHKGYGGASPVEVEKIDGRDLWYFFFDLAEGTLELEVEWDGSKWLWDVIEFVHNQDKGETLATTGR